MFRQAHEEMNGIISMTNQEQSGKHCQKILNNDSVAKRQNIY